MRSIVACGVVGIVALVSMVASPAWAGNAVQATAVFDDPTEINVGYRLMLDPAVNNDANLNATCTVRYRKSGDLDWQAAMDAWRFHPWISPSEDGWNNSNAAYKAENRFAGSIFWLEPGETYDIELTLNDPDGVVGTNPIVVTTSTWQEMVPSPTGRRLYVAPGGGGGSGTITNPFLGLAAAQSAAQPGDVFYLASGVYGAFALSVSGTPGQPICWIGPPDRSAIIDGGGAYAALTLGNNSVLTGYWIVERLTLRNAVCACDAQRVQHVKFRHNNLEADQHGYINRRGEGDEFRQSVMDNEVIGDEPWVVSNITSAEGIQIHGTSAIVAHNHVEGFADGISIDPAYSTTTTPFGANNNAYDCFGNQVSRCGDDAMELDHIVANVRAWRNVATNSRMGFTNQPLFGGPSYIFRNEIFYLQDGGSGVATGSAYKLHNGASGTVLIHNTSSKDSLGFGTCMFQNSFLRNNIFMGSTQTLSMYGCGTDDGLPPDFSVNDWDHNAYRAGTGQTIVDWFNLANYTSVAALAAAQGVELNGMMASYSDLVDPIAPVVYGAPGVELSDFDFGLVPGAPEIDAGAALPNINDPFVSDGAPDIGALEFGQPQPLYGPRPIGDANRDFAVDDTDMTYVRDLLGDPASTHPPADVFIDGLLDAKDLLFVRNRKVDAVGSGPAAAASVTVELVVPGGGKTLTVAQNTPFTLEVRATITGQSLAAVAYDVDTDVPLTVSSRTVSAPLVYVPSAVTSSKEVAVDGDPTGGDGLAPGSGVLVETLTFAGLPSGSAVVSLADLDAAYTSSQYPDGNTFELTTIGTPVTVQAPPSLVASDPPAEGTLAKSANNLVRLTFDQPITLPVTGPALGIVSLSDATDLSGSFVYTVELDGLTLRATEAGAALVNQTWYRITPASSWGVAAFTVDLCTLIGDADGNGQVLAGDLGRIWSHNAELTDARYDINGDGQVLAADLGLTWSHNAEAVPPKP